MSDEIYEIDHSLRRLMETKDQKRIAEGIIEEVPHTILDDAVKALRNLHVTSQLWNKINAETGVGYKRNPNGMLRYYTSQSIERFSRQYDEAVSKGWKGDRPFSTAEYLDSVALPLAEYAWAYMWTIGEVIQDKSWRIAKFTRRNILSDLIYYHDLRKSLWIPGHEHELWVDRSDAVKMFEELVTATFNSLLSYGIVEEMRGARVKVNPWPTKLTRPRALLSIAYALRDKDLDLPNVSKRNNATYGGKPTKKLTGKKVKEEKVINPVEEATPVVKKQEPRFNDLDALQAPGKAVRDSLASVFIAMREMEQKLAETKEVIEQSHHSIMEALLQADQEVINAHDAIEQIDRIKKALGG